MGTRIDRVQPVCDDQSQHADTPDGDRPRPSTTVCGGVSRPGGVSRRGFLGAAAGLAAAGLPGLPGARAAAWLLDPTTRRARDASADGRNAYSMAMHVHSSFSEQDGSMDSQLFQATKNAVDVLWWTDHDARMEAIGYRDVVHFTSLTKENGGRGQGGPWDWALVRSGPLAGVSTGGIVQNPSSPNDPVPGGSLRLLAESTSRTPASYGFYANSHPAGWNYRMSLQGQTLKIDVLLEPGWTTGYLELKVGSSYHQAAGGRAAGEYVLSYRFLPLDAGRAGVSADGRLGVVNIPVAAGTGQWTTATITPEQDVSELWPDMDARDFGLWELTLSAVSTGERVSGYFDYLRFDRTVSGATQLAQQQQMASKLAGRYPQVVQQQGLEISLDLPHLNWFGGKVTMTDYSGVSYRGYQPFLRNTLVPHAHAAGGLVSYNHPFGYGLGKALPAAQQRQRVEEVARQLLPSGGHPAALGCDLLEVGYNLRQGIDLLHHVALWDVLSRNGVFLTGNGTTDDHFGQNWFGILNNWFTSVWAASTAQSALLAALSAGRAWCANLAHYRGSLDLLVDGSVPMGAVSVSRVASRGLLATATDLPAGSELQIVQGVVDYAGSSDPNQNSTVVAGYGGGSVRSGSVRCTLDTTRSSFVRTQVVASNGRVIGLSNPVWLLRSDPPGGIPGPRRS
jgi:hypothetical protein